jgi:gliding motility-associated protein GldL
MAKKESGFMHWYESYSGKKVTGMIYSIGASIVIIGALFKIMHFPGAGPVLMTGMITEAFLFMIGCLDKPHVEFHWENVFPQLIGFGVEPEYLAEVEKRPRPTLLGAGVENGVAPAQEAGKKSANAPALSDADMESLKNGIEGLAKTAVQLQELGKVATSTTKLSEKMEAASEAAGKFAVSSDAVSKKNDELANAYTSIVADMQGVVEGTKAYQKNVEGIGAKLGSINSVYELQLNALQAQVEAYKAQSAQVNAASEQVKLITADVQKIQASAAEAVKSHAEYEAASKKLAQQVADLNKVYGNMLNALA